MVEAAVAALFAAALAVASGPAGARTCTATDLADAVDQAGAALRKVSAETTPRLQARISQLRAKRGWGEAEADQKALDLLADDRIAGFDASANDLLARIDMLGDASAMKSGDAAIDCARIDELAAASLELQVTMRVKSEYMSTRLAALIGDANTAPAAAVRTPPAVAMAPLPPPTPPRAPAWSTSTSAEPVPRATVPVTPTPTPIPPVAPVDAEGYSIDEIKGIGEGFFGKVSTGLAGALEYAFRNSGRPTAYVLGSEGGGALLAGLRYGSGTLYLRQGGQRPIHWHGPSLGVDLGGGGSKVLFLVYKLANPDDLYASFTAIDGSAYAVGGVGVTYVTNGRIVMAPIRAGLGLRLGASIGYLRFTPRPTWNPF